MTEDGNIDRLAWLRVMEAYSRSQEQAARALDILDGVEHKRAVAALEPLTVADAVTKYLQTKKKDLSPDSLATYQRTLEAFSLWVSCKSPKVEDLRFDLFNRFVGRDSIGGNTRNREGTILKGFGRWLVTMGYLERNPAGNLERVKVEKRGPVALTPEEQRELLGMAKKSKRLGVRNYALACLFLFTGVRASEACALKWHDVSFDRGIINIWKGKGEKFRIVPILPVLERALRKLKAKAGAESDSLFINSQGKNEGLPMDRDGVEDLFRDWFRDLGKPSGISVHCLRHSFAVNMLWMGVSPVSVQIILGHSSLQTTSIYAQLYDRDVIDDVNRRCSGLEDAAPPIDPELHRREARNEVNRLCSGLEDALTDASRRSAWAQSLADNLKLLEDDKEEEPGDETPDAG